MNGSFQYAFFTDKGDRPVNEDAVGVFGDKSRKCFILCDGLGGHGMGDVASSLVIKFFEDSFSAMDKSDAVSYISTTFNGAQNALLAEQKLRSATRKMKTTAVVLVADEKNAFIGYIGDSRCYVFQRNKVKTRTLDHSVPQMLVLSGYIKESEIRNHPDRSALLRVMGIEWDEDNYEIMPAIPLRKCDAFLLCSDGFWELIDEKQMCEQLKKASSAEEWLENMTRIVQTNGRGRSMDNYSAIAALNNK